MGSTKAHPYITISDIFLLSFETWFDGIISLPVAFGVFTLSLTVRVLDYPLCDMFPLGTHFLWHIFNGLTLYLAFPFMRKIIKENLIKTLYTYSYEEICCYYLRICFINFLCGINTTTACPPPTSHGDPQYQPHCGIWICLPGHFALIARTKGV